ncbi:MAG: hypothetical protein U0796_00980 [Gemmatales bacterium]
MIEYSTTVAITPRAILAANRLMTLESQKQSAFWQSSKGKVVVFLITVAVFAALYVSMELFPGWLQFDDNLLFFLIGMVVGVFGLVGLLLLKLKQQEKTLPTLTIHFTFREEHVLIELEEVVSRFGWGAYDHVVCGHEFWLLVHRSWKMQYHLLEVVNMPDGLQELIRSKLRCEWVEDVHA